jgi:hypothetical protein
MKTPKMSGPTAAAGKSEVRSVRSSVRKRSDRLRSLTAIDIQGRTDPKSVAWKELSSTLFQDRTGPAPFLRGPTGPVRASTNPPNRPGKASRKEAIERQDFNLPAQPGRASRRRALRRNPCHGAIPNDTRPLFW